jgi:hypothetical protein
LLWIPTARAGIEEPDRSQQKNGVIISWGQIPPWANPYNPGVLNGLIFFEK